MLPSELLFLAVTLKLRILLLASLLQSLSLHAYKEIAVLTDSIAALLVKEW